MSGKFARGFSFLEVLAVATVLSFVSTGVTTYVSHSRRGSRPPLTARDVAGQGRASLDRMVRELQLAGSPVRNNSTEPDGLTPENSNHVAATFLAATPEQVIFEADLDGDGVVERVEYRLHESAVERSAVSKNSDGSVPPAQYEVLTDYVDNGSLPLFRYTTDPANALPEPGNINSVWVSLRLHPPVLDPKRPQFRTFRFDGIARRQNPESESPVAGLRQP